MGLYLCNLFPDLDIIWLNLNVQISLTFISCSNTAHLIEQILSNRYVAIAFTLLIAHSNACPE